MQFLFYIIFILLLLGLVFLVFLLVAHFFKKFFGKTVLFENMFSGIFNKFNKKNQNFDKAKIFLRVFVVLAIVIFLAIPSDLIFKKVQERRSSNMAVKKELASIWGGNQVFVGPIIIVKQSQMVKEKVTKEVVVPIEGTLRTKIEQREEEVVRTVEGYRVYLPEELNIETKLVPETRKRGIYSANVYTADLKVNGSFEIPKENLDPSITINWNTAKVLVGLSDTKALKKVSDLSFNGQDYKFLSGTDNFSILPKGFSTATDLSNLYHNTINFNFKVEIAGSYTLSFAPLGMKNSINMESAWPSPKFYNGLPEKHEITKEGFTASWGVPSLVRNYPQSGTYASFEKLAKYEGQGSSGEDYAHEYLVTEPSFQSPFNEYLTSVELFDSTDNYVLLYKALKYALLFIALTFLSVLVYEMAIDKTSKSKLHIIQYAIIGLALTVFYLLLLAFSEHLIFVYAYVLAALINIVIISLYAGVALNNFKNGLAVAITLFLLYLSLFFILKMEDYSLLSGSILLIFGIMALMYVTRNISGNKNDNLENESDNESDNYDDLKNLKLTI